MPDTWRICLAEDNQDDVFVFKRHLRHRKVDLAPFEDGEKLREHLRQIDRLPHLVLLDLKMPCFNGFDFLEWRRSEPRARLIPVVVLSSSAAPRDVLRAYDLGVQSYFQKPSSTDGYAALIGTLESYWFTPANVAPPLFLV
jgi:two-component system response regulator